MGIKIKYVSKLRYIKQAFGELLAQGMPVKDAAKALRIPRSTANYWRDDLGLPKRKYDKNELPKP